MKKKFVLPLAALSLMVGLAGCDKGGTVTPDASGSAGASTSKSTAASSKMEQIKVTNAEGKTSASVVVGNTIQLTADKDGVTWTSSNESIATVANGLVTTKALGSVKITAKKEGFKDGSFNITVTRPEPTAKIDWKDADHYSVDGSYTRNGRGPGDTPVYSKSQADGGECIGYQGTGDKETLTFTSTAAVAAELTSSMGSNNSVNLADVWKITLNGTELNLAGKAYESDDASGNYTFQEVSFGDANLIQGDNVLVIEYLAEESPYLDNFYVYAKAATTITSKPAPEKQKVALPEGADTLTVTIGGTANINCTETGVKYASSNTEIATVDENTGAVTGVAKGTTTIVISKDGMIPARVTVNVTNPSELIVEAESAPEVVENGTEGATGPTKKTSSSTVSGGYYLNSNPVGSTLTYTFAATAGNYSLTMTSRNYGSAIDDLSTACEIKINDVAVNLASVAYASGYSNFDTALGTVTLAAGNTMTFKVLDTAAGNNIFLLDCFIFAPAA
ncbi:MAG: Ig-like domain-containing protein [Bacilli bacterium]|nr:Ig-like domain-containing protein [Bacilli bacterium]